MYIDTHHVLFSLPRFFFSRLKKDQSPRLFVHQDLNLNLNLKPNKPNKHKDKPKYIFSERRNIHVF